MKINFKKVGSILTAGVILTMSLSACGGAKEVAPKSNSSTEAALPTSAEKVVFKVGLHNPETHPLSQGIKKFGEILEENSEARYALDIFYGGQLGDKATHLQSLQTGVLDISMIMSGPLIDHGVKELKVFTLPYLFDNLAHARATQNSEVGNELINSIQAAGTKMVGIGTYQESARNYFFKNKKVTTLADLKGMKIRAQEGSMYVETMELLGCSAVPIAFSELYSAIQTGVVDGAEQPLSGYYTNKFTEVAKNYLLDGHEISPNIILFSEVSWNKLSDEDKALITKSFDESVAYFNELSDKTDIEFMEKMKAEGVEISEPANPEEWKAAVQPIYEKYGAEFSRLISEIQSIKY